jgi:DNA-binding MarR family transcriptional regulator
MIEERAVYFVDRLGGAPHSKQSLRLWLRMLGCTMLIEKRVRLALEREFGTTLPRFDVLAVLERYPDGLTPTALSRSLMVSNGNVTGLVARLIGDGLVSREVDANDRRSARLRLTRKGRERFARMAVLHERWIDGMCAGLADAEIAELVRLLGRLRRSVEA